jgi:hypothetical protein
MRGVNPRNAGFDSTGAGGPLGDLIDIMFSKEILRINFSGGPTDKPVSAFDSTLCSERYANRVSEIWYSAKQEMRSGQIKGLSTDVIREMTTSKKQDEKGLQLRIRIESKLEMKNHTDSSPDIADSAMGLCELCCERLGFSSATAIRRQFPQQHTKPFKQIFKKYDAFADKRAQLQKMQNTLRL